jgi:glucose-6-phosphate 1-dehydrogenase
MTLEVTCTGMAKGTPPDPCVLVIFGGSGDLARRTVIPSLYALGCQGLLPEPFAIIGFARREWDDEASARVLDRQLLSLIDEEHLYRIDHFLGKETVQNMLVFRFANPGFEPIWNRNYIDHVQITAAENDGIGTRAGYYETAGVVRDMLQNHLLQLLCITAMEAPVAYDGLSLRNETFKVLQALKPVNVLSDCVLGQYGAGVSEGYAVRGYREEDDVPPDSTTPTFVAVKVMPDNWRWAGVPFYLRTGKRLLRKLTQISIHFKPTPHLMFPVEDPGRLQQSTLVFRLHPDEGIVHTFLAKQPGPDICLRPVKMHFSYNTTLLAPGAPRQQTP